MSTYVVGDIHGCYGEWLVLKNRIESQDKDARFILIGDIIDRGNNTYDMIQWAIKHIQPDGKYQMVIGNHEKMKINWWDKSCKTYFENHGVEITDDVEQVTTEKILMDNYRFVVPFIEKNRGFKSIEKAIDWFRTLPFYKDLTVNNKRFIIVHGNVTDDLVDTETNSIRKDLNDNEIENILWDRDTSSFTAIKDATLIYGHTPTIINEAYDYRVEEKDRHYGKIYYGVNRINIDCGVVYRQYKEAANLAALRLEDMKEFYVF